jgi:hypothetical protein
MVVESEIIHYDDMTDEELFAALDQLENDMHETKIRIQLIESILNSEN